MSEPDFEKDAMVRAREIIGALWPGKNAKSQNICVIAADIQEASRDAYEAGAKTERERLRVAIDDVLYDECRSRGCGPPNGCHCYVEDLRDKLFSAIAAVSR